MVHSTARLVTFGSERTCDRELRLAPPRLRRHHVVTDATKSMMNGSARMRIIRQKYVPPAPMSPHKPAAEQRSLPSVELVLLSIHVILQEDIRLVVHLQAKYQHLAQDLRTLLGTLFTLASMFSHKKHIISPSPPNANDDSAVIFRPCAYDHWKAVPAAARISVVCEVHQRLYFRSMMTIKLTIPGMASRAFAPSGNAASTCSAVSLVAPAAMAAAGTVTAALADCVFARIDT